MSKLETVAIQVEKTDDNPEGVVIINASDFDAEVHTLVGAEPVEPAKPVKAEEAKKPTIDPVAAPWNK